MPSLGLKTSSGASGTRPSLAYRVAVYLLSGSLLGLELWAVLRPVEDWPFTSAPMFARYHAPEDPVYRLGFQVELPDGRLLDLEPGAALGVGELSIKRLFFGRYYGSTDPKHPYGHHPNDSPEKFSARLLDFSQRVQQVYTRRSGKTLRAVRITVTEYRQLRISARKLVSRYDSETGKLERFRP